MRNVLRSAIAFGFAAAAGLTGVGFAGVEGDMELGVDRMYGDYANYDLPSGDPGECKAACAADGQCVAWTFVKPGVQANVARCWLKNQTPQPAASGCCISGVKAGGGTAPPTPPTPPGGLGDISGHWRTVTSDTMNGDGATIKPDGNFWGIAYSDHEGWGVTYHLVDANGNGTFTRTGTPKGTSQVFMAADGLHIVENWNDPPRRIEQIVRRP